MNLRKKIIDIEAFLNEAFAKVDCTLEVLVTLNKEENYLKIRFIDFYSHCWYCKNYKLEEIISDEFIKRIAEDIWEYDFEEEALIYLNAESLETPNLFETADTAREFLRIAEIIHENAKKL